MFHTGEIWGLRGCVAKNDRLEYETQTHDTQGCTMRHAARGQVCKLRTYYKNFKII
jgi:hypothetical protein